jgi:hypothetical protein
VLVKYGAASLPQGANRVIVRPSTVASIAWLIWYPSRSDSSSKRTSRHRSSGLYSRAEFYAAFLFPARIFAQRAL